MVVNKSKSAFRTIAEVAEELGVATHVLRFWETKFNQIIPMKASGGRRYYRPDDVEIVKLIKNFLYEKRYTIEGVQKLFKDRGLKAILGGEIQKDFFDISAEENSNNVQIQEVEVCSLSETQRETLLEIKKELNHINEELKKVSA
ncbi:MAG: MerR family transcriptional regulator [Alphaproteobacteria bacterium]|nr:MerR family transcriptional regulator [Alphaproteobacteria bacterium]